MTFRVTLKHKQSGLSYDYPNVHAADASEAYDWGVRQAGVFHCPDAKIEVHTPSTDDSTTP